MKNSLIVLSLMMGVVLFLTNFTTKPDNHKSYHSEEELKSFQNLAQVPIGPGEYFQPSTSCRGCHGYDSLMLANIDENGNDVNLHDRWQSSMMAFSAKDPFWRAKVSHEIITNPAHSNALQTKCTSCHAPMGRYTAIYHGATSYTIADLTGDSLGLDGVACAACHTISPDVGNTFSGVIPFDTTRHIYGPFPGPFAGPMQLYEGYTPTYAPHMDESAVCSSCHTLITETADLSGNLTGGEFVEQATYHEYLNSSFPANGIKCQTCHMPQLPDAIVIANGYINLQPRAPFNQHTFAGANYFMLDLIKNNKAALNIQVEDHKIDTTLSATLRMLKEQSVEFNLVNDSITSDTAYYQVTIRNKTGHKFPSGYPSRRAILQFVITDAANDTVFKSGIFDNEYRVVGENSQFNSHRNIISQNNSSQIYELVMGDVNGQFTTVLERAAITLKDNRIPPDGFTTSASMYDTVKISADALSDPDFNKINSVEGSGIDKIHFHIPVSGVNSTVKIHARLYYQTLPQKWVDEMFALSSGPIDTFRTMYQNADRAPILIASDSLTNTFSGIFDPSSVQTNIRIWPTLANSGTVYIKADANNQVLFIEIYDSKGKKVKSVQPEQATDFLSVELPKTSGTYFIKVQTKLKITSTKVLRL